MRGAVFIFAGIVLFWCQSDAFSREWVDSTGKFRIKAELVALRGETVVLELENGKIVSLPLTRLSKADQAFLKPKSTSAVTPKDAQPAPAERDGVGEAVSNEASAAIAILNKHCMRCHGEGGSDEGGFDFATDREKLVAAGYVRPKDPQDSPLLSRMVSKDSPMPPEGESPRPTSEDLATIRDWIRQGAPTDSPKPEREFIANDELQRLVSADLMKLKSDDRRYARYFSTTHLYNAGVSADELATYRTALAKLLNSLSWNRKLASLSPVSGALHLMRIDLRDLKWTAAVWQQILDQYPLGLVDPSRDALRVRMETSCEIPVVRADWFVASASRPPLYHTLAQIPSTDERLEALLRVNVAENIGQQKVVRIGFARSGVSQNNRLVERHQSIFGAYWKSYDFAGNTGRKNLFEHPLGPGRSSDTFEHDGGEIIFRLPNGMLAYMLTDAQGRRIDRGPIEIVSDPRQLDRTVVNGVSCMSCHYGGFIQKSDEIRRHVVANVSAYRSTDRILGLYPESETAAAWIEKDTRDYLDVLAKEEIGIASPTRAGEPIVLIANRYQNELDLKQAAAELGLTSEKLLAELEDLNDTSMDRTVGALKIQGGVIKRDSFDQVFLRLASRIKVGRLPVAAGNAIARTTGRNTFVNGNQRMPAATPKAPRTGNVSQAALEAFQAGVAATKKSEWQKATDEFDIALRQSGQNDVFKSRVYEQAIPVYERGEAVEPLLEAHQFLLDACSNTAEIEQAKVNLFNSLVRFTRKSRTGWFTPKQAKEILWGPEPLPTSISSPLAMLFENQLRQKPDHEPALRVMLTYWTHVRNNNQKRFEILKRLDEILSARGESIGGMDQFNYAHYHATIGDAEKGAKLFAELARKYDGLGAANSRIDEAKAWIRADQDNKAASALRIAQRHFERGEVGASNTLEKIGDLFASIGKDDLAVQAYRSALRVEKSPYRIESLQQKARGLLARTGPASSQVVASGDEGRSSSQSLSPMTDDLLDPNRAFRTAAKQSEQSALKSPTSAVYLLIKAAGDWIKAGEQDDAVRVLKKVTLLIRKASKGGSDYEHKQIAELYQNVSMPQQALEHWAEAIKRSKSTHTIEGYQGKIEALIAENPNTDVPESMKQYVDSSYGLRMSAKEAEKRSSSDPRSRATNLVQAADLWSQAGDVKEARRVGGLAISQIRMIAPSSSYHPGERLYVTLAESCRRVGLFQEAVVCLVGAIGVSGRDDDAVKYHRQLKAICEENGLSLPDLPDDFAKKLDPLNRFRVAAAEKEKKARESTSESMQLSYWLQASTEWLKANENEKATKAADEHLRLLLRKGDASDYAFRKLGEIYEKIGDDQRAIKAYEHALKASKSEYQQKKLQEKINALR